MSIIYNIDLKEKGRPYPHYWEFCVGSCHAATVLREDVRKQIRRAHEECGFQYLRFHGLFDDDMSVVIPPTLMGETEISFYNIDSIFDFLLEIGMKPFVELGFMPEVLASGSKTCFHYKANITPPADDEKWISFIREFGRHLISRYGRAEVAQWYFEVWNEPNLNFFFAGTKEQYFHLYRITAQALKSVDSIFRLGGPATSANAWIPEFITYCEENAAPLDFITTHHYPTDDPNAVFEKNDSGLESVVLPSREALAAMSQEELSAFMSKFAQVRDDNPRDIMRQMTQRASKEAGKYPLFYTEWNGSDGYDTSYQAAFVVNTLAQNEGMVQGYSYWTVSDIFEETGLRGAPFLNAFGLQNIYGIAKPVYRIFQALHEAGNRRLTVSGEEHRTVQILALTGEREVYVFVYNHDIQERRIEPEEIILKLEGEIRAVYQAVIDKTHCNPRAVWEEMGSPRYPGKAELAKLEEASELRYEEISPRYDGKSIFALIAEPESVTIFRVLLL